MSNFKCGTASHAGQACTEQLDHYLADAELGLWLVSDGVRERGNGSVASKIVVDSVTDFVKQGSALTSAIQLAHNDIVAAANDQPSHDMTATIVAAQEADDSLELAWVGNSRAYLYDMASPETVRQLSTDHSYMQLLVDTGTFHVDDLMSNKDRNVLTISMGDEDIEDLNAEHMQQQLGLTQKVILCSDGLNKALSDNEIAQIMAKSVSIDNNAKDLVDEAVARGVSDDVTVIVISRT